MAERPTTELWDRVTSQLVETANKMGSIQREDQVTLSTILQLRISTKFPQVGYYTAKLMERAGLPQNFPAVLIFDPLLRQPFNVARLGVTEAGYNPASGRWNPKTLSISPEALVNRPPIVFSMANLTKQPGLELTAPPFPIKGTILSGKCSIHIGPSLQDPKLTDVLILRGSPRRERLDGVWANEVIADSVGLPVGWESVFTDDGHVVDKNYCLRPPQAKAEVEALKKHPLPVNPEALESVRDLALKMRADPEKVFRHLRAELLKAPVGPSGEVVADALGQPVVIRVGISWIQVNLGGENVDLLLRKDRLGNLEFVTSHDPLHVACLLRSLRTTEGKGSNRINV